MNGKLTFGKEEGGVHEAEVTMTPNLEQETTNKYQNPEVKATSRRENERDSFASNDGCLKDREKHIVHEDWVCEFVSANK